MEKQLTLTSQNQMQTLIKNAIKVLCGSAFLALMSQLSIPLPFSPVPLSMQTFAVFLLGAFLGPRIGALSVIAYLAEGSAGLPVFAGGLTNPLWFCSARTGYLIGFVIAAFVIGKTYEYRPQMGFFSSLLTMASGAVTILAVGALWLSIFVGPQAAITMGVLPFLIADSIKIVAAACIAQGFALIKK
ncbi:MAG: BioY protein [Chlamydiia bacterium]|nr:BioY protein [Chlamydiia bacterium]